jgi:hypothetical protein
VKAGWEISPQGREGSELLLLPPAGWSEMGGMIRSRAETLLSPEWNWKGLRWEFEQREQVSIHIMFQRAF